MPKFMKDKAIVLLEGAIESYLLGLYGLSLPNQRVRKHQESKYAPVMGLFGASSELFVKACLVQAKGVPAMYRDGGTGKEVFKFGTECIDEFRKEIRDDSDCIKYIWKDENDKNENKELLLNQLNKFHLLQTMRANGLHAGEGCSKDVAITVANELFAFIQLLSRGKRLKAYLKGIPAPDATIRDREAIIEDLSRRMANCKTDEHKIDALRGMYLVLPYVPEIKPDWIDCFDKIGITPPTQDDVNCLLKTLKDAHSIYLLKNRGGKEGIPVRIEPHNPDALPIAIQNIKRTLGSIPDQFRNDILTANTRFEQGRLDLPIDDFLIDLFALGLDNAGVLEDNTMLTAQQAWPFIVAAYSTAGAPRPCWEFVAKCNELDKLISILEKTKTIGNGYYKRRAGTVIQLIRSYINGTHLSLDNEHDKVFDAAKAFIEKNETAQQDPFTPQFIRNLRLTEKAKTSLQNYIANRQSAGCSIEEILKDDKLEFDDKRIVVALMKLCRRFDQRNGLVAIMRSDAMKTYHSEVRKRMFFIDIAHSGVMFSNEPD